ncbi:MAG: nitroreductase [Halobacteriota archaeon]
MDVIDAINSRSTVRAFKRDPVEKDTMLKILEAATRAPSWGNSQPWELFVASGDVLERLREGYSIRFKRGESRSPDIPAPRTWPPAVQERMRALMSAFPRSTPTKTSPDDAMRQMLASNYSFFGAPTVVFLCMDRSLTQWSMFDMGSLAQSIMLAAQQYGVDSAIAVNFVSYPDLIRAELDIPDDLAILIGLAVGHADADQVPDYQRSSRRPLTEVVRCKGV